ncbi:MAG: ABC transporter ATP-binding protein [Acholeplasmataceae bacterium]|nr:ABC transporter ATP-binding protein [Acholeplasmataceae bacterium]
MITIDGVTKKFKQVVAVNNISLEVKPGEIFGLVGPDGAGKTTMIRMLTGIMEATSGSINVLGSADLEQVKSRLGYVPQKFSLCGDLTVMENIWVMGSLYGESNERIDTLASEILGFTKLLPFKDRLADNLSGGMKQKLALAAGLMHKPEIYFLDEPTTGVDPVSRREFWQMLYKLNKEGTTIFVSTPYMDEAEFCTRVAFMHNGVITTCDSPQALRKKYPYKIIELATPAKDIKKVLASLPILDINAFGTKYHLVVEDFETAVAGVKEVLGKTDIPIISLKQIEPNLEDVFVLLSKEVS